MKILYWLERFLPYIGGVETFSRQLIPAMQKRGHSFAIITSGHVQNSGQPEQTPYGSIWHFPFADVLESHDLRRIVAIDHQIAEIVRTFQPDLIHLNTILPSTFFYLRNRATSQIPTLLTLHMPVSLSRKNGIIEQVLNRANYVAAVSQAVLQEASETIPGITARASVNYNGLLDAPLAPAPLRWSPPVLLCVGRLAHQKGFDIALEAFPQILDSYPTAILRVVGSGELETELRQQTARLGLTESVQFTGPVSQHEVYQLMNQASLVLVPSRYEPFGLVALEAAQMARPVVASRVDGLTEVVAHRETGLLVEPEHSDRLADAVLSLLNQPALSEQYGQHARRRAENMFSFEKFADAYDGMYHQLCS